MNRRNMPPLNSLRAFESAARNMSVSKASEELGVTASAVGHQIRNLEKNLGVRLFDRRGNRLVPTQTGARLAQALEAGFDALFRAAEAVQRQSGHRPVTISATPAVALRWLAPVLDRFRGEGFDDFRIDASSDEADLAAGEADIDIRYGRGSSDSELISEMLFSEAVFPVCSCAMVANLAVPADVTTKPLLFVDDWGRRGGTWSAWADWFQEVGLAMPVSSVGARFSEMDKAVAEAAAGRGIAMGAQRHLERYPDLVRPFSGPEIIYGTFLVALPEVAEEPGIRRLIARLVSEARKTSGVLHEGAF